MIEKEYIREHAQLFDPSAAELATLRLHEAGVTFEIMPPIGISEGRQSRVSILEYRVGDRPERVLWKRMGAGKGLTENEAKMFHERLRPYRAALVSAGWNMPELFHTTIVPEKDEWQIFSYEQLIGHGDGDKMLANPEEPNFRKWHLLRRAMETLAAYPSSTLPHGLDLKLANVVLDEQGKLWFVDLFGPKELMPDGSWRTFSSKLDSLAPERLLKVCATREGMALRMYRLAEKVWIASGGIAVEKLRSDFITLLESLGLPDTEVSFIEDEIRAGFPWLDSIYEERRV
jgi:hypothetical protein